MQTTQLKTAEEELKKTKEELTKVGNEFIRVLGEHKKVREKLLKEQTDITEYMSAEEDIKAFLKKAKEEPKKANEEKDKKDEKDEKDRKIRRFREIRGIFNAFRSGSLSDPSLGPDQWDSFIDDELRLELARECVPDIIKALKNNYPADQPVPDIIKTIKNLCPTDQPADQPKK